MHEPPHAALLRDPDHVPRSSDVDRLDVLDHRSSCVRQRFDHRRGVEHGVDPFARGEHVRVLANVTLEPPHVTPGFRRWLRVEHVHGASLRLQCSDEIAPQKSRATRYEAALPIER